MFSMGPEEILEFYPATRSRGICIDPQNKGYFASDLCRSRLHSLRKKSFGRHSERSEESLLIRNKGLRGILRAKSALRMTQFCIFPQPVQPRQLEIWKTWALAPEASGPKSPLQASLNVGAEVADPDPRRGPGHRKCKPQTSSGVSLQIITKFF